MTRKPADTSLTGFPPTRCHAVRHLTGSEYAVYDQMRAYARPDKDSRRIFYGSVVPTLCNALALSRNRILQIIANLYEKSWLIKISGQERNANGTVKPNAWEIVDHDDYVKANPDSCPPYEYADHPTAAQFGVKYGEKFRVGMVPANFGLERRLIPESVLFEEPNETAEARIISDEDYECVQEYIRQSVCRADRRYRAASRKPDPVDRVQKIGPGEPDRVQKIGPGPRPEDDTSRVQSSVQTASRRLDGILIESDSDKQTPTTLPLPSAGCGVVEDVSRSRPKSKPLSKNQARTLKELIGRMQAAFAEERIKGGSNKGCPMTDEHERAIWELYELSPMVEPAWLAYAKSDDWNLKTEYPAARFFSGYAGYVRKAELSKAPLIINAIKAAHLLREQEEDEHYEKLRDAVLSRQPGLSGQELEDAILDEDERRKTEPDTPNE